MSEPAQYQPVKLHAVPPGRTPPHALDAERSLLGGVLLDNSALDDVLEALRPADFYRETHRKIYESIVALHARHDPVDRVTVKAELLTMGALDAVGGESFVDLLDTVTPNASSLLYYADIVHSKAIERRIIEAAHHIAVAGYEQSQPTGDLIEFAETRMLSACEERKAGEGLVEARRAVIDFGKDLEKKFERGVDVTGLPSGLADLDYLTTGFQPGELIVLAARPSVGKSALAFAIAGHCAMKRELAAGVFSLEMPAKSVVGRLIAQFGEVDAEKLRKGNLADADWHKHAKASSEIAEAPLAIDDRSSVTAADIRGAARRMRQKYASTKTPLGLIVVDYLQLMNGDGQNSEERISRNSSALKHLARELNVPLIALSQLNREMEKGNRRPQLSDLRGSGSLEQDADVVIFLYRPRDEEENGYQFIDAIVAKQRNGPIGDVKLRWSKRFTRFEDEQPGARKQTGLRFDGPPPHTDDDYKGG